jgi:hypothetical protein
MFTYDVTATGPKGFQVSVTGPTPRGTSLMGDFGCWPWSNQSTLTD